MQQFVWLEYPATGGKAQFSTQSAGIWRLIGWVDCEPPDDAEPIPQVPSGPTGDITEAAQPAVAVAGTAPAEAQNDTTARKRGATEPTTTEE